jgi:hypothetical protein
MKGRKWLAAQDLPAGERAAALLRQLDFCAQELALIDADLAGLPSPARRLANAPARATKGSRFTGPKI